MIAPADLLGFAFHLVSGPDGSETAARRTVSASYYALFHAIAETGASLLAGDRALQRRLARSYDHATLSRAARDVQSPQARGLAGAPHDARLVQIAETFNQLRAAREFADYDLDTSIGWDEAEAAYWAAVNACRLLQEISTHTDTAAFVLAPLMQRRRG